MPDHGGDVEAVHGHQVHVGDLLGGRRHVLGELVLGVHEEDGLGPAPRRGEAQQLLGVGGGELEVGHHVEVVLDKLDAEGVGEPVHPQVVGEHVVQRPGTPGTVHLQAHNSMLIKQRIIRRRLRTLPPLTHCGARLEPCRARPVPFCGQGLAPPP